MTTALGESPLLDVILECQATRVGTHLVFSYQIRNGSAADVYVMDALPAVDPSTRKAVADRNGAVVYLMKTGEAHVLKGIAPLPIDRSVTVRIIPLAAKVVPGEALSRQLEVPLPLAETSPYFPDLPLRQYELIDIPGVLFSVEFWRSKVEGFTATAVDFAPDLYRVATSNTVGASERLSHPFPTQRLSILKRPNGFPRPE